MLTLNITSPCRICLSESHSCTRIYDKRALDGSHLYEAINAICQLNIAEGDGLPEYICAYCEHKLSEILLFRRKSHEGREVLLSMQHNAKTEEHTNGTVSCLPREEVDGISNPSKRRKDDQRTSDNEEERTTPLVFSEINIKTEEMSDSSFTVEEEGFQSNVEHGESEGVRRRVSKRPYSDGGCAVVHAAGASGTRAQMRAKARGGASCDDSSYTAEEEEGINPNAEYITAEEAEGGMGYLIEDEVTRNADNALVMRIISQADDEGQEGSERYKTEKQALVAHSSQDPMEYQEYGSEKDGPFPVEVRYETDDDVVDDDVD